VSRVITWVPISSERNQSRSLGTEDSLGGGVDALKTCYLIGSL
jgi:hypothetical protein